MPVCDPIHNRTAKSGDNTNDNSDDRATDRKPDIREPVAYPGKPTASQRFTVGNGAVLPQKRDDLRDRENTKSNYDKLQSVHEVRHVISGHAQLAGTIAFSYCPDHHTETRGRNTLQSNAARENSDHRKAEDCNHQEFWCPKLQNDWARNQDEHGEKSRTDEPAK